MGPNTGQQPTFPDTISFITKKIFVLLLLTSRRSVLKQKVFYLTWFTGVMALETLKFLSFRLLQAVTSMLLQGCLSHFQ